MARAATVIMAVVATRALRVELLAVTGKSYRPMDVYAWPARHVARSSTTPVAARAVHAQHALRVPLRLDRAVAARPAQRVPRVRRKRGRAALAAALPARPAVATFSTTTAAAHARHALLVRWGTNRPALDVAVSESIVAPGTTCRARHA